MFKEPDSPNKAFALGALLVFPLMMLMLGLAIYRIVSIYGKPYGLKIGDFIIPFVICYVLILISQYIHEYIHAFFASEECKKRGLCNAG